MHMSNIQSVIWCIALIQYFEKYSTFTVDTDAALTVPV